MMQSFLRRGAGASAAVLALGVLAGCAATCPKANERIEVEVVGLPDMNDQGSGPQHVRYRVWAVRDGNAFLTQGGYRDGALHLADPKEDGPRVASQFGQPFHGEAWLQPNGKATLGPVTAVVDEQYRAVGIVVLFPEPKAAVVHVDCAKHPGYLEGDGVHKVRFQIGASSVTPGP